MRGWCGSRGVGCRTVGVEGRERERAYGAGVERERSWPTFVLAGTAGTVAGVVLLSGWLLLRTRGDTSSPEALAGPRAAASLPVSTPSPDRPEGLRDVLTGVSFPCPGPRWDDEPLPGPHNAAVVADHWACEYDRCYHGMIASGGPVAGADLRAFALREGDELHVK